MRLYKRKPRWSWVFSTYAVDVVEFDLQAALHREMLARASLPCGDRHQCALETGPYPCLVTLAVHALIQDAEN